ncbi:MAG: BamA/TamA family outer membrane protein [Bacteroidetes bacterium]|nr:BamA/TamA family outer membrane protein [Bacteroidota bacterium]
MRKRRFTYPLLLLLCALAVGESQAQQRTVTLRYELHGADALDEKSLLRHIGDGERATPQWKSDTLAGEDEPPATLRAWMAERTAQLRERVITGAAAQGFPFAHVDSVYYRWTTDSTTLTTVLHLRSGPLLRTGDVSFTGNEALSDEALLREIALSSGTVFDETVAETDLRRIVTVYEQAGYPFAAARIGDIMIQKRNGEAVAHVTFSIEEGMLFYIDEIIVEGNTLTQAHVIVRETRIAGHERYDPEIIGDIRRRLERLRFFDRVEEPLLYVRDSIGGILLRVEEGNTNQFDGIVGYQPPRGTEEEGSFTGLVNMHFRNLFGTGRQLDARWERATTNISELELHYHEPWVAGLPISLSAGLFQRQQDSAYVRRNVTASVSFLWSSNMQLTGRIDQTQVIPSIDTDLPGLAHSKTLSGGIELYIDTRDNVYNPRSGITLRNSYSGGNKRIRSTDGDVTAFIQRLELDAGYFQEVLPRAILALELHGRELRGGELDLSDLYRLGGANTLRGYREEQFNGTRLGWTSIEFRYSLGRRTFAFAFLDFGYIEQSPDPTRNRAAFNALRNGYGIGSRLETALGIISVSYALGEGDGFADGKIHFGLVNAF